MNIKLEMIQEIKEEYVKMVTDFFNFHRKLLNTPKSMYQTDEASKNTLEEWHKEGLF